MSSYFAEYYLYLAFKNIISLETLNFYKWATKTVFLLFIAFCLLKKDSMKWFYENYSLDNQRRRLKDFFLLTLSWAEYFDYLSNMSKSRSRRNKVAVWHFFSESYAAFTLNGFDIQERNLTFVKTDFQVLKLKFHACKFKKDFYLLHKLNNV